MDPEKIGELDRQGLKDGFESAVEQFKIYVDGAVYQKDEVLFSHFMVKLGLFEAYAMAFASEKGLDMDKITALIQRATLDMLILSKKND